MAPAFQQLSATPPLCGHPHVAAATQVALEPEPEANGQAGQARQAGQAVPPAEVQTPGVADDDRQHHSQVAQPTEAEAHAPAWQAAAGQAG